MVPRYSAAKLNLAYKDTKSLLYCVETENVYQHIAGFKHLLDLSDFPQDHFLYDPTNKSVPLTMTDALQDRVLGEVVCLRSKLYSNDFVGGKKQSAKGVAKCVKKTLHHEFLKKCLLSKEQVTRIMFQLKSFKNQIVLNTVEKIALSVFDDKRYILNDGIASLAYGQYAIPVPGRFQGIFSCFFKKMFFV